MTDNVKRKVKILVAIWKAILEGIGESLLFGGWINVFLSTLYVLLCFCTRESPFNCEWFNLGLGFLWGFFSVTLNYELRKK